MKHRFCACFALSWITAALAWTLTGTAEVRAEQPLPSVLTDEQREKITEECNALSYNKRCAKFFESENDRRRSEEFCAKHPEEEACIKRQKEKLAKMNERVKIADERELARFCEQEPRSPRCLHRKKQPRVLPRVNSDDYVDNF